MDCVKYENESKGIHCFTCTQNQSWIRELNFHNHLGFFKHMIMPKVNNKLFQHQWELHNKPLTNMYVKKIYYLYICLAIQPTFTEHLSYGIH